MDKRAEYTIGIKSEGLSNLTKVIDELEKAGVETSEFKREAALLRQQLAEMQQQQQLIDSFAKIKQETTAAASAFEAAQAKAQQLGRELAATEAPTKKQATDFARAREAVNSTKDAYQAAQVRLQSMRGTLAENGIETAGLAQKQALLRNGVRDVETAVAAATSRLKELGTAGPKAVNDTTAATDRAAASTKAYEGSLTQVAQAVAGVFAAGQVTRYAVAINDVADQYKNLESRVRLAVGEQVNLQAAVAGIAQVAKDTHSNLDATAELFGRLAASGKELNITNAEALGITKTINQSIQVSGASAQASEASVRQLVQALQSGTLRGDEFNSIMEQAPRLAKALADGLQVPVGALRGMAEQGELTSARVVKALKGQAEAINKEFASLPLTTGRALEDLRTQWTLFVGGLDATTNASSYVAAGINSLANNLDTLARVAGVAGAALTAGLAVQGAAALRAYAVEATAAAGATNLLAASISRIPKVISITVAAVGFEVGYQVGQMLYENSELARKLGVGLNGFMQALVSDLILLKDAAAAIFTDDTVNAALDRYIARGKEMDLILADMWKDAETAPAKVSGAADAGAGSLNKLGGAGTAAGQAIAAGAAQGAAGLGQVARAGEQARAALTGLATAINTKPATNTGLTEIVSNLAAAKQRGEDLDKVLREQMPEAISKLSGPELVKFRADFTAAMNEARLSSESFDQVVRTGLGLIAEQAAASLGVDLPAAAGKTSQAFRDAQSNLSILIRQLPELKAVGVDTGAVVGQALSKMLDGAKNQAEIDAVILRVRTLRKDLGDKIADGLLDQAKAKAEALTDALDKATPGVNSLREAMGRLGVESDASLKKTAEESRTAYDTMSKAGTASVRELSAGFRRAAEEAIAANNGIAPSWVTAQAGVRGYKIETDGAGKSSLVATDKMASGWRDVGRAAQGAAGSASDAANVFRKKLQEIYDRNKVGDGSSLVGKSGDVREAAVMETDINQDIVKRYGEDMVDNPLTKQAWALRQQLNSYKKSYGNVTRSQQSLDQQRNIAAELTRVEGLIEQKRVKDEADRSGIAKTIAAPRGGNSSAEPTTAREPVSRSSGMSTGAGGPSYVSNLTITGVGAGAVRYADAESQRTNEDLLRKLAQAKTTSI